MVYDKPMTTISIREAMHWGGQLGSSTEHLQGGGQGERHPPLNQREASGGGGGGNTEIVRSREEERVSLSSTMNPSSSKFTTRGRWSPSEAS